MDTDSIAFVHEEVYYRQHVSNFSGEITDEITEEFG
jgi:hypothetical protein